MCWNLESSWLSYIIGSIASLLLLIYGSDVDKNLGIFFLAVVQIQLIEYFIWKDNTMCGELNNKASKYILPVLTFQAFLMIFGAYLYNSSLLSDEHMRNLFLVYLVITLSVLFFYNNFIKHKKLCSKKIKNKGIKWDLGNIFKDNNIFSHVWILFYFFPLFIFPLLWKSSFKKYIFLLLTIGSFILIKYYNSYNWESRWCYPSSLVPVIFVILMLGN